MSHEVPDLSANFVRDETRPNSPAPEQVRVRLALLKRALWSFDEVKKRFGVDFRSDAELHAQYATWSEERHAEIAPASDSYISRNHFELFLQKRGLISLPFAAASLGMNYETFHEVLKSAFNRNYINDNERRGEFTNIYSADFVSNFYNRFSRLENTTFTTYSGFARLLHREIEDKLGVTINPLICLTSLALNEEPPEIACTYDDLTDEPMGLPYQVWIETHKPIQLRADSCSWATFIRYESVLVEQILGQGPDEEMEERRHVIEGYFGL